LGAGISKGVCYKSYEVSEAWPRVKGKAPLRNDAAMSETGSGRAPVPGPRRTEFDVFERGRSAGMSPLRGTVAERLDDSATVHFYGA